MCFRYLYIFKKPLYFIKSTVFLFVIFSLFGCSEKEQAIDATPPHTSSLPKVVIFGDSLVAGSGMLEDQQHMVWVNQFRELVSDRLNVIGEGRGGRWTSALNEYQEMMQRNRYVDYLVIALGTNDSNDISKDSVSNATDNIRKMIILARARYGINLPILVLGPPSMYKEGLRRTRNIADQRIKILQEMNHSFSQLALEQSCYVLSLFEKVPLSSMIKDGHHPDANGNTVIANAVYEAMNLILDSSERPSEN